MKTIERISHNRRDRTETVSASGLTAKFQSPSPRSTATALPVEEPDSAGIEAEGVSEPPVSEQTDDKTQVLQPDHRLADYRWDAVTFPPVTDDGDFDIDDRYPLDVLRHSDRQWLLGPCRYPEPCRHCGHRSEHAQKCPTRFDTKLTAMPWGKHKGVRIQDCPTGYLKWLDGKSNLKPDLANEVTRTLYIRHINIDDTPPDNAGPSGEPWDEARAKRIAEELIPHTAACSPQLYRKWCDAADKQDRDEFDRITAQIRAVKPARIRTMTAQP